MAKKKKIIEEHKSEPVTNCDQSKEVVTNCDNQQFAVTIGDHKNIDIKSMIRVIRSQQVMLDFELASFMALKQKHSIRQLSVIKIVSLMTSCSS